MRLTTLLSRRLGVRGLLLGGTCLLPLALVLVGQAAQTWTPLAPIGGPPVARMLHSAVYSQENNRMIVFGGFKGDPDSGYCGPSCLNDVWVLANADGTGGSPSWTQLSPTGTPPSARGYHSAVFDGASNRMVVFAGDPSIGFCSGAVNDVWVLTNADGTGGTPNWAQLSPTGILPDIRQGPRAVYDSATNRMIVFGGGTNACGAPSNAVWVLTNANGLGGAPAWTQLSPIGPGPAARGGHASVYDAASNRMVVFGGTTATGFVNDVWVLANANGLGGTPAWTQLAPAGGPPTARLFHSAVYDPATQRMVVFGGHAAGDLSNQIWELTNANGLGETPVWSQLTPAGGPPAARDTHTAVLNTATNRMIVYAGRGCLPGDCFVVGDAWVLGGAVAPVATTVALAPAAGIYGTTTDLQATLSSSGGVISGATVDFTLDGVPVGSEVTDGNGIATLSGVSIAGRDAGAYPGIVGASFAATSSFQSSNGTGDLTVSRVTPSIAWPFPAPITHAAPLGPAQLNATASFNSTLVAGTFIYAPAAGTVLNAGVNQTLSTLFTPTDATNYESVTGNALITVNPSGTSTTVQSSASPSVFGAAVTFTATVAAVAPGTGTPAGTMQFNDNGTPIGGAVALAGGVATINSSTLTVGSHAITAVYNGDVNFNTSTSSALSQVVTPAPPEITVTGGTFVADGSAHPATATATDSGGAPVAGTFSFTYGPGGASAPVAPGRYSASASFTSSDPGFTNRFPWTTMAPDPHAKSSPAAAEINGKLYVQGFDQAAGASQSSFVARLSIYDPASNTWALGASPTLIRAYTSVGVIDGKMYVVGGCLMSDCGYATNVLEIYNPATNTWSNGAAMPTARFGTAVGVIGGKLYVTGGTVPWYTSTNATEIYDPASNSWTTGTAIPISRELPMSAVVNGELYVMGGYQRGSVNAPVNRVDVYNPATGWSARSAMPTATWGGTAGVIGGQIYVVGGWGTAGSLLAANQSYDPAVDTWTQQAPMMTARTYIAGGVVNAKLYVIDGFGGTQPLSTNEAFDPSLTTLITINPASPPVASFTANPNPSACNQIVSFDGSGSHASPGFGITTYAWDFGDGATGTGAMAIHAYNAFGSYTATLTVTDNNTPPQTDSLAMTVTVNQGNQAPVASTGGPYSADLGAGLTLNATGSSDPNAGCGDSIVSYAWTIDGTLSLSGATPILTAPQIDALGVGSHTVSLTVTDELGATGSASTSLSVYNNTPTASFTASPNPAACNQGVTFNGGASYAGRPDRPIVSYAWDFGDGTSASGQSPTHSYSSYGSYTATLTVTDNNVPAKTAAATQTIDVNQGNLPPFANSGGSYTVAFGGSVQLNGTGSSDPNAACGDQIVSYAWTIDGAISLSGAMPTLNTAVNPLSVGVHDVLLTVTDAFGATSTVSTVVTVQSVLVSVEVTPSMATIGVGGQQSFQAIGHFNDGSTSLLPSGGTGGGGSGQGPGFWSMHLTPGLNIDVCATPQYPASSFIGGIAIHGFTPDAAGDVHTTWSNATPVVNFDGTITPPEVNLTLTCTGTSAAPGSLHAMWTGVRYEGTATFDGGATSVQVSITGWSSQAAMPTRRFSFGAATVNGLVYSIGGGNELSFVTAVDAYDPTTDMWTTGLSPMPTAREGLGVAALNGRIYAVGGRVPGGNPSSVVEVYDPAANTWTTLAQSEWMPTARAGFALVTDGTYLYAIGGATIGANGGHVAFVERYDPIAHIWSTLTPMPAAGTASAGVINETIVVFGSDGSTRTDVYDIATDTWHSGMPMPAQRGGMAVAPSNGGLWLVGGTSNGSLTYDTWVYYPATSTQPEGWASLGSMLTARWSLAAAVVDEVVYALGGAVEMSAPISPLSTNEALSTPPIGDLSTSQGPADGAVLWQSTDSSVATIDQNGNARGVHTGDTTIVASAGSITCLPDNCGELAVINTVPSVQIFGGPFTTNESQFQNFGSGGSFSDPDPQSWTATVDYGDGTGTQVLPLFNVQPGQSPTAQFNLNHTYADNGVFTVTVTVDDQSGGVGAATAQVTVNNAEPQMSLPMTPPTTQLGSTQNFGCAAFFDQGPNDAPWSATVDYGDGAGPQTVTSLMSSCGGSGGPTLRGAFNLSHAYTSTGTFTVTATVTDKDGAVGTGTTSVTVNSATPSMNLTVSPPGSINYGQNVTFTATVTTSLPGVAAPTGTVTFTVEGIQVVAPTLANGQASYSTNSLEVGNHTIVATYSGDVNFSSAFRSTSRFIGRITPSMTLTSSSPSSTVGDAVTFTATVGDPNGVVTATGSVTFTIDGSQVASPNLVNGQAMFSTSSLSIGSHGISASYAGDVHFFSMSRFTNHFVEACQGSVRGTILNHGAPFTGLVEFIVTAGGDTFPFTTDTGGFSFDEVEEGAYHLQVVPPPGYTATPASIDFTVSCGEETALIFEVADATPPVMTLLGANPMTVEGGSAFTDPGATATDVIAGDLTSAIVATGTVDTSHVGSYTRIYTVSDGYNTASTTRTVNVVDTTPPTFTAPSNVTIDPTSPSGATYIYATPVAIDAVGPVTVACNPPSGSVFPIGTTIVTCTATDQAGNSTTHTFTVTVLSPEEVVANLIAQVGTMDFQQVSNLLQNVLRSIDRDNVGAACNQLGAFINQVQAQSGRQITADEAAALIQAASAARGALGCGE